MDSFVVEKWKLWSQRYNEYGQKRVIKILILLRHHVINRVYWKINFLTFKLEVETRGCL